MMSMMTMSLMIILHNQIFYQNLQERYKENLDLVCPFDTFGVIYFDTYWSTIMIKDTYPQKSISGPTLIMSLNLFLYLILSVSDQNLKKDYLYLQQIQLNRKLCFKKREIKKKVTKQQLLKISFVNIFISF